MSPLGKILGVIYSTITRPQPHPPLGHSATNLQKNDFLNLTWKWKSRNGEACLEFLGSDTFGGTPHNQLHHPISSNLAASTLCIQGMCKIWHQRTFLHESPIFYGVSSVQTHLKYVTLFPQLRWGVVRIERSNDCWRTATILWPDIKPFCPKCPERSKKAQLGGPWGKNVPVSTYPLTVP